MAIQPVRQVRLPGARTHASSDPLESATDDLDETDADPMLVLGSEDVSPEDDIRGTVFSSEGTDELDQALRDLILAYLAVVDEPTDEEYHQLALAARVDPKYLESITYKMLADLAGETGKDDDVSIDLSEGGDIQGTEVDEVSDPLVSSDDDDFVPLN